MMWDLTSLVRHAPCQRICAYCGELVDDGMRWADRPGIDAYSVNMINACSHCYKPDSLREYATHVYDSKSPDASGTIDDHTTCSSYEGCMFISFDGPAKAHSLCREFVMDASVLGKAAADPRSAGNDNSSDAGR